MNHFFYIANVEVEPENLEQYLLLGEMLVKTTKEAPGYVDFKLLQDRNDARKIVVYHEWESPEDMDNYCQSEFFKQYMPQIGKFFTNFSSFEGVQIR